MEPKLIGAPLPNIPFEERTEQNGLPFWRSAKNPIIYRNPVKGVARIYNSAVVPFGDGFAAVFRGDTLNGWPLLYVGFSKNGYTFDICEWPICMEQEDGTPYAMEYGYDPRVVQVGDTYYVLWCDGLQGQPTIGLAETKDFKKFIFRGHPVLPYSRNGVLFPRKIGGEYVLLTRPSDQGHTPYGDIYLSYSKDLTYWGKHKLLMQPKSSWERLKIGAGPAPIETSEGWLLLYHGVTQTCSGYVYSMGGALLDRDDPSKVLHRSENYLLTPEKEYECVGFVPNVVFPCSTLTDSATGRIALYYGCADTVFSLAFSTLDQIINYIIGS